MDSLEVFEKCTFAMMGIAKGSGAGDFNITRLVAIWVLLWDTVSSLWYVSAKICCIHSQIQGQWYFRFLVSSVVTLKHINETKARVCIRRNVILSVRAYVRRVLLTIPEGSFLQFQKGLRWPGAFFDFNSSWFPFVDFIQLKAMSTVYSMCGKYIVCIYWPPSEDFCSL